ncbi:poly-beta-1,6-N-acetyl-D-glucosamine N-deacetylase PgaB [Uruburuella testudinis]|uniref:Poly-beta-1,6-N-acetyl-D-glucosamine N-deacetylase PgaB n=1 Tax=Uruburuella testudinis TaxID=1282863 RepID=A0ABY4DRL6_9NEIS|nr:poly-beta-1,6-N-acetyl-D-glucosamine N-deacetylase PgaB [Uruburuella testudinis]UOO81578.1 poly-beta-1,6-N-acetyl-D-glucosamine N-deacetylase PgaB [Uruburuella testudinis]
MKFFSLMITAVSALLAWTPVAAAGLGTAFAEPAHEIRYGALCYHDVVDETRPAAASRRDDQFEGDLQRQYFPQTITVQKLVAHFNWLQSNGYTPVSWAQIQAARAGQGRLPEKPVLLTFDDGYESFYRLVFPLLKAYRFPAVFAVVTGWLDTPEGGTIAYGRQQLPRRDFVSWAQVKEMHDSGLVEIASHTHNLHRSLQGNPGGSQFAAVLSGHYRNGRYETESEYRARLRDDFRRSAASIARHTGQRPRVMVWPYGQFSETAAQIAREEGYESDLTLNDKKLNTARDSRQGRELITQETRLDFLNSYLNGKMFARDIQRVVHVDLDYVYDPDPAQLNRNLDKLVQRMADYGISTVYLQAYADSDGNGVAEALYFPNRYLKVKADLFSRVAWQLMTRAGVEVYAWMPMMAFDFGGGHEYITHHQTGRPDPKHYLRLSPYHAGNREKVAALYRDLAFHSRFNGILFHDDGFLTDFEANGGQTTQTLAEAGAKTDDLIAYSKQLQQAALAYSYNGSDMLKSARNIYAGVVMDPQAEKWFAQSLSKFAAAYDYTAIMAMPYMEHEQPLNPVQAQAWLKKLTVAVKGSGVAPEKTVFELQARNWRTEEPVRSEELAGWMQLLKAEGIRNFGYYPDDFLNNRPDSKVLHPYFSMKR